MTQSHAFLRLLLGILVWTVGCEGPTHGMVSVGVTSPLTTAEIAQTTIPDAGDEAFARRAILTVWGRHPTSEAEVAVLTQILTDLSRADLVRAMVASNEYIHSWEPFIRDALAAERIGARSNELCYLARSLGDPGPLLAKHVRDHAPLSTPFSAAFTMGDLIRSSLRLDDLSAVFRVHQFANLVNDFDLPDLAGAIAARESRAEVFMRSHWNRRTQCLDCHNSEWSVTYSDDAEANRAWPVRGLFEKAIFSDSRGLGLHQIRSFFRRRGVVTGVRYEDEEPAPAEEAASGVSPWGFSSACGLFFPPNRIWSDDLDDESYLAGRGGRFASVWDLEAILHSGFDQLRDGLDIDSSDEVSAEEAAAWLIAMHFTDRVVGEVLGARLTIENDFPRTEAQRDLLAQLTDTFVASGFSLRELLVAITNLPEYNRPLPSKGVEAPEPFARIFDPWTGDDLPRAERSNGMGHRVHRLSGRSMLRSISTALDVTPLREYPLFTQAPETGIHSSIGVYLKEGQPAYAETTFQSLLALEHAYGACQDIEALDECTFETYLKSGGGSDEARCEICAGSVAACDWDARCCNVPWEAYCTSECLAEPLDPGYEEVVPYAPVVESTWIDRLLLAAGQSTGTTLSDVVVAIKNRLTATTTLTLAESALIEDILMASLDAEYTADHDRGLRRVCGALLGNPYFILGGHEGPPKSGDSKRFVAGPGDLPQEICQRLNSRLFEPGTWHCTNGNIERM